MEKMRYFIYAFTLCILLSFLYFSIIKEKTGDRYAPDCYFAKGACVKEIGPVEVVLDLSPKPVMTMRDLDIRLELKGAYRHENIVISFDMPDMYMGRNEVVLKRTEKGLYAGKAVLPRCPSGKRLWRAAIDIPNAGRAEFLFDVAK